MSGEAVGKKEAFDKPILQVLDWPAPRIDGDIVAVAVTQDLTFVTSNGRDFAGFEGVQLQCWHQDM